jgi:RES domain-containing protein
LIVYRICHPDYAHDLSGTGAALHGARWNPTGMPMLYTAETSSLAILEFLVHIKGVKGNMSYKLLSIDTRSGLVETLSPLPADWSNDPNKTVEIGEEWLRSKRSLGLRVPSVHNPLECNILLNPRHPNYQPVVVRSDWYWYDGRLIQQK